MSFCARLRRRPSCADLLNAIIQGASPTFTLTGSSWTPQAHSTNNVTIWLENDLPDYDLSIPFPPNVTKTDNGTRLLRVVVLTPSCTTSETFPTTLLRLEHLASLTGGVDVAVIFHLCPSTSNSNGIDHPHAVDLGITGLARLNSTLLTHPSISALTVLPLPTASALPTLLQAYVTNLTKCMASIRAEPTTKSWKLLPHCTVNGQLDRQECYYLTDVFESLSDLANALNTHPKDKRVEQLTSLLGPETMREIVDFWREEWVAD